MIQHDEMEHGITRIHDEYSDKQSNQSQEAWKTPCLAGHPLTLMDMPGVAHQDQPWGMDYPNIKYQEC